MSSTALSLILVSAFMHAGWNFLGKKITPSSDVYLIALTAGMITLLPIVGIFAKQLNMIPPDVWILVTVAGLCQAVYFFGLAGAYRNGDLSIAYPVARSFPILIVMGITFLIGRGDEISLLAVAGFITVVISAFFLPMRRLGEIRMRNYINVMSAFALAAAAGTAGYSLADDAALRIMRMPEVLGDHMTVTEISFLYLSFEAIMTVVWVTVFFIATRVWGKHNSRGINDRRKTVDFIPPVLMGIMIYATYGLVLISMAYAVNVSYIVAFRQVSLPIGVVLGLVILKEKGGWVRLTSVIVMVFGLVLVAIG